LLSLLFRTFQILQGLFLLESREFLSELDFGLGLHAIVKSVIVIREREKVINITIETFKD